MNFYNQNNKLNAKINYIKDLSFMAKKISSEFPFSKTMVFFSSEDYFAYGKSLIDALKEFALKPVTIILNENTIFNREEIINNYSVFEDVRSVIYTNKKLLPLALNLDKNVKVYCLITNADTFGYFVAQFYLQEKGQFIKKEICSSVEYFVDENSIKYNHSTILKQVAVCIVTLMDYLFYKCLTNSEINGNFYGKIKKILVSFVVEEGGNNNDYLFSSLLELQKLLFTNQDFYYSSPTISSYLINKDFFDLDNCYFCALSICDIYSCAFKDNKFDNKEIGDGLKALAFLTGLDFNYLISQFIQKQKSVYPCLLEEIKGEIFNLITLFKHCNKQIQKEDKNTYKRQISPLKSQALLSGLTPISINGISGLYF